ncbi:MAG TPA: threonine synthase [Ktedonobacterales bacterium]|nr:threonine synthase [Ktedonobacterales bacterium]
MSVRSHITVRVPATCANLGPGFDCLGLAITLYTSYRVEYEPASTPSHPTISIELLASGEHAQPALALPADERNLFYVALIARLAHFGAPPQDLRIQATFDVPPERGLGTSAAAVVGGLLAAGAIAEHLNLHDAQEDGKLLDAAVALEHGQHADNAAAALAGGLVVSARDERRGTWRAVQAPLPDDLRAVLFIPDVPMDTARGRALLPPSYSRADAVHNVGHAALLVAALATGTHDAIAGAMDDRFHEPYRARLFPQLPEMRAAAYDAGALGVCLSGGGSTVLAIAADQAERVADAMREAARALRVPGHVLMAGIDRRGAVVTGAGSAAPEGARKTTASLAKAERAPGQDVPPSLVGAEESGMRLRCPACGASYPLRRMQYRCSCGQPLDVARDDPMPARDGDAWRRLFDERLGALGPQERSGVWRFRELLMPLPAVVAITRPEGQTNCYFVGQGAASVGHKAVGAFAGAERLWVKHEGENPTGSFKDRGMTVGVSIARWLGAEAVACASTGNTAASMAAYAAQAGLRALVLLPEGKVAAGKLSQALAYGAEIRQIAGDFDRAMVEVERLCQDEGIYLLNSLNPFRILGQQSLAFELAQQFQWDVPDWIVLPAGNLGNTSALGIGLLTAFRLGLIERLPRIAAIQAAGANPFYQSYRGGFVELKSVQAHTLATAINIGDPVSYLRARDVIRATRGVVGEVTDDEILRAKAVVDRAGIGCEPASAASVAGVRRLVSQGTIQPHERVVAVLTGNLLKDPDAVLLAQRVARGEEVGPC